MSGHEAATGPVMARAREIARVDVLVQVALEHFDRTVWREIDDARTDFVAHLVAATAEPPSSSHHRAATTEQPPSSSTIEQPPSSSHHRAATIEQPPPSSHHRPSYNVTGGRAERVTCLWI